LKVKELPEIWNQRMEELIGITPPNDSLGVLQDIHWAHATIGYFPTYAIGSMIAAQLYYKLDLADRVKEGRFGSMIAAQLYYKLDLADRVKEGRFGEVMGVLKERVHKHGSVYSPEDLLKRTTGDYINPDYFLRYLNEKYQSI